MKKTLFGVLIIFGLFFFGFSNVALAGSCWGGPNHADSCTSDSDCGSNGFCKEKSIEIQVEADDAVGVTTLTIAIKQSFVTEINNAVNGLMGVTGLVRGYTANDFTAISDAVYILGFTGPRYFQEATGNVVDGIPGETTIETVVSVLSLISEATEALSDDVEVDRFFVHYRNLDKAGWFLWNPGMNVFGAWNVDTRNWWNLDKWMDFMATYSRFL